MTTLKIPNKTKKTKVSSLMNVKVVPLAYEGIKSAQLQQFMLIKLSAQNSDIKSD